jgi:hypothetical protein
MCYHGTAAGIDAPIHPQPLLTKTSLEIGCNTLSPYLRVVRASDLKARLAVDRFDGVARLLSSTRQRQRLVFVRYTSRDGTTTYKLWQISRWDSSLDIIRDLLARKEKGKRKASLVSPDQKPRRHVTRISQNPFTVFSSEAQCTVNFHY